MSDIRQAGTSVREASESSASEPFIFLTQLGNQPWMPGHRHPSTCTGWHVRGIGGVRLRAVRCGRGLATKKSWVEAFFSELAEQSASEPAVAKVETRKHKTLEKFGLSGGAA